MQQLTRDEQERIDAAHRYHLRTDSLKCEIFTMFDNELTPDDVRYLLRERLKLSVEKRKKLSMSVTRYYADWNKAQPKA